MRRYLRLAGATAIAALVLPSVAAVAQVVKRPFGLLARQRPRRRRTTCWNARMVCRPPKPPKRVYDRLDFTRALLMFSICASKIA
ncbi:hypothetical protein CU102_19475 [Phyllobacterium brassicacearum]|uniref:Uncharacterized protein n=1 Tax=Phyllobacterium brassicacearum TaxID=314235 RepID=A0A2P7BGQ0_9HYPH|nr:hypothetical protein [Phyllobacterium brassicacearum]PSH65676.1 hypothetical protein CU102_19475 [Phyllobacterium brassicacearum]TDQ16875.1 hypothetical protein DEV91_12937 [Phyllobacterium brassicacearum]